MAQFKVYFWDGSIDSVIADDARKARKVAASLSDSGVQKVVLMDLEDDIDDEDPEEEDEEEDDEDE